MQDIQELVSRFRNGEQRALGRLITLLENEVPERDQIMKQLYNLTGRAYILGVTGSPGAGKSSLVDKITIQLRQRNQKVGIIAVDPSSPFSGGALLGDRIRMQEHALDKGVFIRSMGTRGSLGGLARTTREVVKAMDAFGTDWVIIETVGVGQAELDIMHVADTTVVVLTPGAGDAIQTIKAGIMEIADVFAVNKADLPGAQKVVSEVEMMLNLQCDTKEWRPPVRTTSSLSGQGLPELLAAIDQHHSFLVDRGWLESRRQDRAKSQTLEIVDFRWQQLVRREMTLPGLIKELLSDVATRKTDPYTAATAILEHMVGTGKDPGLG